MPTIMQDKTTAPSSDGSQPAAEGLTDSANVAEMLREMASLLDAQGGNNYRAAAFRKAADSIAGLNLRDIFERDGLAGLDALPAIGPSIAAAIGEMLTRGRWSRLDRLRGDAEPEVLFSTIPGVGPELARSLHENLGVDTLEALELAACDGRLELQVPRIGVRRAAAIRAALTQMLDRNRALRRRPVPAASAPEPPVELLLDVDREYREGAMAGKLPTIAPRRFNPDGSAWLPVLHNSHGDWHFTALYSNTARAHQLDRVHDWVILYCEGQDQVEHQYTVVTPAGGVMAGRRVVRGRESECRDWYVRSILPLSKNLPAVKR
jgi:DNA polymerase (family X)